MTSETGIRKGRKYAQVLTGAREVFLRDGFDGASVDDIARAAGVSKATLYSYFPDKRLLFMEVAQNECHSQTASAEALIADDMPSAQVLHIAATRMVDFLLSPLSISIYRVCAAEADRFPEIGRVYFQSGPADVRARLTAYLSRAVAQGELRIDDYELAADQFVELCKADLFMKALFGLSDRFTAADRARVVDGAVAVFLARYRA
jgi:TetR/AcrR family transcriptional regulator, mexJK operon transcriptional repressor